LDYLESLSSLYFVAHKAGYHFKTPFVYTTGRITFSIHSFVL